VLLGEHLDVSSALCDSWKLWDSDRHLVSEMRGSSGSFVPPPNSEGIGRLQHSTFCEPLGKNCISWCWLYKILALPDVLVILNEFSKLKMAWISFSLKVKQSHLREVPWDYQHGDKGLRFRILAVNVLDNDLRSLGQRSGTENLCTGRYKVASNWHCSHLPPSMHPEWDFLLVGRMRQNVLLVGVFGS
jgi:hypothetical protein